MTTEQNTQCPHCQAKLVVKEELAGKRVRCRSCRQEFVLSADSKQSVERQPLPESHQAFAETLEAVHDSSLDGLRPAASPQLAKRAEPSTPKIGRFEVLAVLGQGAFGRVYKARDPQLDRFVALKVPTFGPQDKPKIQRFLTEAKSAAKLHHPNIVPTYECGQTDGKYFIAAQFVSGQPLSKRLKDNPPDCCQAAEWVRQLAGGLAYAHGQGIVHRDIKPDNIMLSEDGIPQIMDFGLAKRVNEDAAMTTDGSILGTPAYMPPEQARGDMAKIGPHSDQYSLGVVLYELLTGKRPFEGPPHSVIAQVISAEPPAPRSLRADIPKDLEAICQKAMSKEPERRYESTAALAGDVDRWLRGESTTARPISILERFQRWRRREPAVAFLGLVVVLLVIAGMSLALILAATSRHHANQLEALLVDLSQEKKRSQDGEKSAKQQADEAIQQRDRADTLAAEAVANLELANTRSEELKKALNDFTVAKSAESKAIEQANLSGEEQRKADYRASLAEASKALGERRFDDALAILAKCPVSIRDATWNALHDQADRQHFKIVPFGNTSICSGRVLFPPDSENVVIDGDDALRVLSLDDGRELLSANHTGSRAFAKHLTLFIGTQVALIYGKQIVRCDLGTLKVDPPWPIPRPKTPQSKVVAKEFEVVDGLVPYLAYLADENGKLFLDRDANSPNMYAVCSLLDRSDCAEYHLAPGLSGAWVTTGRISGREQLQPVAVDFYGSLALFVGDSGHFYLESRSPRLPAYLANSHSPPPLSSEPYLSPISLIEEKKVVCMSLVGDLLAFAYNDKVIVIDAQKSERLKVGEWEIPKGSVSLIALSPDGKLVATYGHDRAVVIRESDTGAEVRIFANQVGVQNLEFDRGLTVLSNGVSVASKPHETRLGWVSEKGLCIWETETIAPHVDLKVAEPTAKKAKPGKDPLRALIDLLEDDSPTMHEQAEALYALLTKDGAVNVNAAYCLALIFARKQEVDRAVELLNSLPTQDKYATHIVRLRLWLALECGEKGLAEQLVTMLRERARNSKVSTRERLEAASFLGGIVGALPEGDVASLPKKLVEETAKELATADEQKVSFEFRLAQQAAHKRRLQLVELIEEVSVEKEGLTVRLSAAQTERANFDKSIETTQKKLTDIIPANRTEDQRMAARIKELSVRSGWIKKQRSLQTPGRPSVPQAPQKPHRPTPTSGSGKSVKDDKYSSDYQKYESDLRSYEREMANYPEKLAKWEATDRTRREMLTAGMADVQGEITTTRAEAKDRSDEIGKLRIEVNSLRAKSRDTELTIGILKTVLAKDDASRSQHVLARPSSYDLLSLPSERSRLLNSIR